METSRAKQDAPPPVYLEKSRGVGQELGCSHQQGRPRGPARLSRGLNHPASPYKGGAPPGPRGPEAGDSETPGRRLGSPGQLAERCPQTRQQRPDSGAKQGWPLGGARRTRAGAQSVPTPPGLGSNPHHPPTRRPAGLTRRGGSRPAAPRGNRTAARGCHRPRWLRPRLARRPPPPGRRASPAESAALTSPARGAPSAAAGARPVPAAPAAAPARAPRPRKRFSAPPPQRRHFRAGADRGAGDAGLASLRDSEYGIPLGLCPGASPRTNGRAAALVPTPGGSGGSSALTASRPPSPRRPLLAGGGLLRGARPGLPERNG